MESGKQQVHPCFTYYQVPLAGSASAAAAGCCCEGLLGGSGDSSERGRGLAVAGLA